MAQFKTGESGNPSGRPRGAGGGRTLALANLDKMLARSRNQALLIRAMELEFKRDPVRFFRNMIMPLLPREAKLSLDHEGVVSWTGLLGVSAESVEGGRLTVDGVEVKKSAIGDSGHYIKPVQEARPEAVALPDSTSSPQAEGE